MTTSTIRPHRPLMTRLVAIIAMMLVVVVASQVVVRLTPTTPTIQAPAVPFTPTVGDLDAGSLGSGTGTGDGAGAGLNGSADLARIRANVEFWAERVRRNPDDFVSSNRLGIAEIDLARATGDVTAYLRAEAAFATTLQRDPTNAAALGYRGSVLVSLHRFADAAAQARAVLERRPDDPVALATLGDASLEIGDIETARSAYGRVHVIAGSAATEVRLGHLAFVTGDTVAAIEHARAAVSAAAEEGAEGERAAFYAYQLADVLISTGDRAGAEAAYRQTLAADPGSFLAHSGLARVAAANGDLDLAIDELSAAIAIVPQPQFLARRGDLYTLRGGADDAKRATADFDTIEAIALLAGEAAGVYDRTLVLYLANHGLDPERAVRLAEAELAVRQDVFGYDAAAWAMLAAGRAAEADALMAKALAFGTRDAKLLYHAGMIDASLGRTESARSNLQAALDLDASFDPLQVRTAMETLAALP